MYPRGTPADSAKVIGVRRAKVYKFAFQPLLALSSVVAQIDTTMLRSGAVTLIPDPSV